MNWYKNYLGNFAQTPNAKYRDGTQAFIDSTWEDTTLLKDIEEETFIGSNVYVKMQVLKNSISEFFVNSTKDAKDFRRIMFQDINHKSGRGMKYRFDNNYWLVYEETTEEEPYPEISVRRCNNIIKWVNIDNGAIIEEPCILDYTLSSPSTQVTKDVTVGNSKVTVILQGNENTRNLRKNDRFIFNGVPYSFKAYNNYMQNDYVSKEVPLLFLDCYLDTEQPTDDLLDNVANRYANEYTLNVTPKWIKQVKGFKGFLKAEILRDGDSQVTFNEDVIWESSVPDAVTVNELGEYQLVGAIGNSAWIRCYIKGNEQISHTIYVEIVESVHKERVLVVTPPTNTLAQYQAIFFSAEVYEDGVKIREPGNITCTPNWQNDNNYTLEKGRWGEGWLLTNKLMTAEPLILTFTYGELKQTKIIDLTSA